LGDKHKPLRLPPAQFAKLNRQINKIRLFNKEDYGYYRYDNPRNIDEMYPDDTIIPKSAFSAKHLITKVQRVFNTEQLGLEANNLRTEISEGTVLPYLEKKEYVRDLDFKKISSERTRLNKKKKS